MMIRTGITGLALAAAFAAGSSLCQIATAGEMSADQIRDQLKASKTRSLSGERSSSGAEDLATINRISRTRSLSAGDREQMAAIAARRPAIDLDINFAYNSAVVSPTSERQLDSLGQALTSSDLKGAIVMLAGHTDAKGGDGYNQALSERRAESVKRFLMQRFQIAADQLVAVGYGKKKLKNRSDPFSGENRRVQVVNMAEQDQAAK